MASSAVTRTLTGLLAGRFDSGVRSRGNGYYLDGLVSKLTGDDTGLKANVDGGSRYKVLMELAPRGKTLRVACTCPYFTGEDLACKHLWAVIIAAERKGLLKDALKFKSIRLVDFDDEDDEDGEDYFEAEGFDPEEVEAEEEEEAEDAGEDELVLAANLSNPATLKEFFREQNSKGVTRFDLRAFKEFLSRRSGPGPQSRPAKPPPPPPWEKVLNRVATTINERAAVPRPWDPAKFELWYTLEWHRVLQRSALLFSITYRERKANGEWSKHKSRSVNPQEVQAMAPGPDRDLLAIVQGTQTGGEYGYYYTPRGIVEFNVGPALERQILPLLGKTGRCQFRPQAGGIPTPLRWEDSPPARFTLSLELDQKSRSFRPVPVVLRGDSDTPLGSPNYFTPGGMLIHEGVMTPLLHAEEANRWVNAIQSEPAFRLPADQSERWLGKLLPLVKSEALALPPSLAVERFRGEPRPRLKVKSGQPAWDGTPRKARGELAFDYEAMTFADADARKGALTPGGKRYLERDLDAENAMRNWLVSLGFKRVGPFYNDPSVGYELPLSRFARAVHDLTAQGWHVEADGKLHRTGSFVEVKVSSGIDWFEVHGKATFGDQSVDLPTLLRAIRKGESVVTLDDGTLGILPEEWITKYAALGDLGEEQADHLQFKRTQAGLLDALLAAQPQVSFDAGFTRIRDELRSFEGIAPAQPPPTFKGELRGYQAQGLGWLHFLRRFGLGGCLADDMGLGKTVQVLALLEERRLLREQTPANDPQRPGPSLVVVPRSLIFNWKQEAARFTPAMRVLDHTGPDRTRAVDHFTGCDLVLTTYGTLRRDAAFFKDARFDMLILDEAQAVKNSGTEAAKAVRLLRGEHRLAMSGTPVENHLGDLWSLFDFLNPGMLGKRNALGMGTARSVAPEGRAALAQALRPFILRRTKAQVAKDLPEKTEQSLLCELPPEQRALYDELREHYRQSLITRVATQGLAKSKIQVLEALLRLRQAACHPGLIDKARAGERSAKLDLLVPRLIEVVQEGHKAVVFSQFTTFLGLLKKRLAAEPDAPAYEYLDGKTTKRQACVERFQNDPDCRLFLVSLKAGGFGLNLTAAEYVFLLDPWWNPAVEAQAVDRAHRIGQEKPVFAYRLIARDTVEEKIVELQNSKRDLADAIINADNSLIRGLTREDLDLLLS